MPTAEPKRCWFRPTPDRFVVGLLLVVCLLWLSERFQWFGFNHHKGWTVLIAVAAVSVAFIVMLLWWIAGLIFGWRFQFRIRSLLAFCLACSVAAAWLAVEMRRAEKQREVVEGIRSMRGSALYDSQVDADNHAISNSEPPEPRWLRDALGESFFSTVGFVNFSDTTITDAGLEHLKGLTRLRQLHLGGTKITDAGLEYLKGLTQIRKLYLLRTKITDTGLEHLKGLTQLLLLHLYGTKITDAGLEHLKGLTHLRWLYLTNTKVTDAGVEKLQHSLPNCKIYH